MAVVASDRRRTPAISDIQPRALIDTIALRGPVDRFEFSVPERLYGHNAQGATFQATSREPL